MKANELIKGLTEDNEVLIDINGRDYRLKDGINVKEVLTPVPATEHWMEDGIIKSKNTHKNIKTWHYILTADVPPSAKTIDIYKVEKNIRKRITEEYQRANSLIERAVFGTGDMGGQITLIDVNAATDALLGFIKDELLR